MAPALPRFLRSLLGPVLVLITGCSAFTPPPGTSPWGEPTTGGPGWRKVRSAAAQAARSYWTWAPLLVAGVLQVDDLDHRIAEWARVEAQKHFPVVEEGGLRISLTVDRDRISLSLAWSGGVP